MRRLVGTLSILLLVGLAAGARGLLAAETVSIGGVEVPADCTPERTFREKA